MDSDPAFKIEKDCACGVFKTKVSLISFADPDPTFQQIWIRIRLFNKYGVAASIDADESEPSCHSHSHSCLQDREGLCLLGGETQSLTQSRM